MTYKYCFLHLKKRCVYSSVSKVALGLFLRWLLALNEQFLNGPLKITHVPVEAPTINIL